MYVETHHHASPSYSPGCLHRPPLTPLIYFCGFLLSLQSSVRRDRPVSEKDKEKDKEKEKDKDRIETPTSDDDKQSPSTPNDGANTPVLDLNQSHHALHDLSRNRPGGANGLTLPMPTPLHPHSQHPSTNSPSLGSTDPPAYFHSPLRDAFTVTHIPPTSVSPNHGNLRGLHRTTTIGGREHSNSPTSDTRRVHEDSTNNSNPPNLTVNPAIASHPTLAINYAPQPVSPLRRDLTSRFPPALNLQSRVRLARELDSPEPSLMKEMSPRLSARLSQTAAIRRDLARQASATQQQQQQSSQNSPLAPTNQTTPPSDWPPTTDRAPSNSLLTPEDLDPRGRSAVLNPRRRGGNNASNGGIDSPASSSMTSRFLPSPTPMSGRLHNKRSVSNFSQAIDLIDATSSPDAPDFSPASRHSLRASRHSLGQPPVPLHVEKDLHSGRRSTRGRGRGRKIALIVDNNTLSQRLTSVALHRIGFTTCDLASEGEAAISMASNTKYELILMDSTLPTLSSIETARAIRWMEDQRGDVPTTILALVNNIEAAGTVSGNTIEMFKQSRFNACFERGCILTEAIGEIQETLQRNPNFLTLSADGVKKQEVRTELQDKDELEFAIKMSEIRNSSPVGHDGAPPAIGSNRRLTSTGRTFVARKPSVDVASGGSTLTIQPTMTPLDHSPNPNFHSNHQTPSPTSASSSSSTQSSHASSSNASLNATVTPTPMPGTITAGQGSAFIHSAVSVKPRRASLSIHSIKDCK